MDRGVEIFFSTITAKWKKANQQEKDDLPVWVSLHGNKLCSCFWQMMNLRNTVEIIYTVL